MPPSFRGVSSVAFGAKWAVVWLVTVFNYDQPSSAPLDFSPYIPGWSPHGGRDPPARIGGLMRSCGICPLAEGAGGNIQPPGGEEKKGVKKGAWRTPHAPIVSCISLYSPILVGVIIFCF